MIRIIITVILLLTIPCKGISQKNKVNIVSPASSLRFNILGLTDITDHNLSFGFEKPIHPNWSAGTDIGWVFWTSYIEKVKAVSGIIARPFVRYYPKKNSDFWEAELHYKYVSYKIQDWLGRIPDNNIPAYEEFTSFYLKKQALGIHFKWGTQENLSRNKKLKFEFVSGIGIRFKKYRVQDGIYIRTNTVNSINTADKSHISVVLPVNMRLVYAIK